MSRSRKSTSICGFTTKESEKSYKQETNRALRLRCRVALLVDDLDSNVLPLKHEVRSQWGPKDGKQRFDAGKYPQLMRK